jgi:hypothetical protein
MIQSLTCIDMYATNICQIVSFTAIIYNTPAMYGFDRRNAMEDKNELFVSGWLKSKRYRCIVNKKVAKERKKERVKKQVNVSKEILTKTICWIMTFYYVVVFSKICTHDFRLVVILFFLLLLLVIWLYFLQKKKKLVVMPNVDYFLFSRAFSFLYVFFIDKCRKNVRRKIDEKKKKKKNRERERERVEIYQSSLISLLFVSRSLITIFLKRAIRICIFCCLPVELLSSR